MQDMMQRGSEWLTRMRKQYAGRTIVYHRGDLSDTIDGATKGKTAGELQTEHGMTLAADISDWIIPVNDLVLNGQKIEPEEGDQIVETLNGTEVVWEVASPGEPEPAWKYEDQYRQAYRIHTKQVPV